MAAIGDDCGRAMVVISTNGATDPRARGDDLQQGEPSKTCKLKMDFITELIVASGAGGVVAFALAQFLGKTFVRHELDKSLHSFDARLTQKTESLKTELSIYAHEQNVAVSRLDAQRAKAIQDVYAALRAWTGPASAIAAGSPLREADDEAELEFYLTHAEQAHQSGKALADALSDNAIYFDLELYGTLAALSTECMTSIARFLSTLRQGLAEGAPPHQLLHYADQDQKVSLRFKN